MPVAVYYGDEGYLLEIAAQELRDAVVNPAMASLCHRVVNGTSLATVLEAVGGVSLALGGKTLMEIRDFVWLNQAAKDKGIELQLEELRELLESMDPNKTVLFLSAKIDGKLKFSKWLTKNPGFQVQKFEAFKFWEGEKAVGFLQRYTREKGIQVSIDALELLVSALGVELRPLINEVEKLALYAHGRAITLNDAQLMVSHSDNVFQLMQRWVFRESPEANFHDLNEILLRRHPVEIFKTFQNTFNTIFRVVWMNSQGVNQAVIAERTGQKPFSVRKNLDTFRRVPMDRMIHLKQQLVDLEWRAKTGKLDATLALEALLGA